MLSVFTGELCAQNHYFIFCHFSACTNNNWFKKTFFYSPLRVASRLKQFEDDGFVRLQLQRAQSHRPQTVHSCAGHKHSPLGQVRGPSRIQDMGFRPSVEQDEEVDTAPRAQEGQDRGRGRRDKRSVGGGVEGEESKAAIKKSFFSGSGVTEGGKQRYS